MTEQLATWYDELGVLLMGDPFVLSLEYIGTFAGAISGVRLASAKRFDWFGAYVIGFVTALGGGTLRDLLMNLTPFWMKGPSYIVTTFLALISISLFGRRFISEKVTWFVFDTISISLFTVFGVEKALAYSFAPWCAVMMGVITAVFGGILRDVMLNEVPLIFRKEIYAMACFAGAVVYVVLAAQDVSPRISATLCVALIFVIRALAIRYKLAFPILKGKSALSSWRHHHEHHDGFHAHHDRPRS